MMLTSHVVCKNIILSQLNLVRLTSRVVWGQPKLAYKFIRYFDRLQYIMDYKGLITVEDLQWCNAIKCNGMQKHDIVALKFG